MVAHNKVYPIAQQQRLLVQPLRILVQLEIVRIQVRDARRDLDADTVLGGLLPVRDGMLGGPDRVLVVTHAHLCASACPAGVKVMRIGIGDGAHDDDECLLGAGVLLDAVDDLARVFHFLSLRAAQLQRHPSLSQTVTNVHYASGRSRLCAVSSSHWKARPGRRICSLHRRTRGSSKRDAHAVLEPQRLRLGLLHDLGPQNHRDVLQRGETHGQRTQGGTFEAHFLQNVGHGRNLPGVFQGHDRVLVSRLPVTEMDRLQ